MRGGEDAEAQYRRSRRDGERSGGLAAASIQAVFMMSPPLSCPGRASPGRLDTGLPIAAACGRAGDGGRRGGRVKGMSSRRPDAPDGQSCGSPTRRIQMRGVRITSRPWPTTGRRSRHDRRRGPSRRAPAAGPAGVRRRGLDHVRRPGRVARTHRHPRCTEWACDSGHPCGAFHAPVPASLSWTSARSGWSSSLRMSRA
jgi:hypothetical protein